MVRTEAQQAIESIVKTLLLAKKRGKTLHGAVIGPWGSGKTHALKSVLGRYPVFYLKAPQGDVTRTRLIRLIGLAIGAGASRSYDYTLDLIRGHVQETGLHPLLLIDEAQRIFPKPTLLDELKDLSEDPDLSFSYLFVGDLTLKKFLTGSQHHSLVKRILYKTYLSGEISTQTIEDLLKLYGLKGEPAKIAKLAKKNQWKVLDLDNVCYLASLKGVKELNEDAVSQVLRVAEVSV